MGAVLDLHGDGTVQGVLVQSSELKNWGKQALQIAAHVRQIYGLDADVRRARIRRRPRAAVVAVLMRPAVALKASFRPSCNPTGHHPHRHRRPRHGSGASRRRRCCGRRGSRAASWSASCSWTTIVSMLAHEPEHSHDRRCTRRASRRRPGPRGRAASSLTSPPPAF